MSPLLYFGIVIPFLIFQITVIIFIIHEKTTKNKFYCSAFFTLFLMITIIDTTAQVNTLIGLPVFPLQFLENIFLNNPVLGGIVYQISSYTLFTQCYIHFGIAVNRFWISTTIINKSKTVQTWKKIGNYLIFCLPLITIPFIIPRFFFDAYVVRDQNGSLWPGFKVSASYQSFILIYSPALCVLSAVISFMIQIATLVQYKLVLKKHFIKRNQIYQEIRLLCQAIIVLFAQMLMTGLQVVFTVAYFSSDWKLNNLAAENYLWVQNVSNLSGPIALMFVARTIRKDYFNFLLRRKQIKATFIKPTTGNINLTTTTY